MGKASRKKQSLSPEAGRQADLQADSPANEQAGFFFRPVVHVLIIVLLGLLAYSNTFQSPFQWDETDFIIGNPIVRDLGYFTDISRAEGLPVYDGLKSRYIGYLTFALNYKFHGFNVLGYHIVNIAIHLINATLVYFFILLTFRTPFFSYQRSAVSHQRTEEESKKNAVSSYDSTTQQLDYSTFHHSPFTIHYSHLFALAVALLFVAHPIQTEAVTYVFQRLASLVSLFYLLSLVLYIKGRLSAISTQHSAVSTQQSAENSRFTSENPGTLHKRKEASRFSSPFTLHASRFTIIWYLLSLLSAVLAMKTKENAFTLPVIITLYEFLFFSGPVKTRLVRLVPFLLTMLIVPLTIMATGSSAGEIISQVKDPASMGYITPAPQDYFFSQFRVIVTYIRLLFLPVDQNIDYDYPLYQSFFTPPVLSSFLCLAVVFGFGVYLVYKTQRASSKQLSAISHQRAEGGNRLAEDTPLNPPLPRGEVKGGGFHDSRFTIHLLRLAAFGILWFFITLSVESSIIPIPMLINEYRAYLPSLGFFLALVSGAVLLLKQSSRFTLHASRFTKVSVALFALIIVALASATYARNAVWSEKISLWEDTVRKSPGASRVTNNLGIAYYEKGRYDEAIRMYERSILLNPNHLNAYMNLGVTYAVTGRLSDAMEKFTEVIARDPKKSPAYLNLARAYTDLGRPYEAIENYLKSIAVNPNYSPAYHGLGTTYARLGRLDEALAVYSRFVELSPHDPEAYGNRGLVYLNKGDVSSARADFQQACSLGNVSSCQQLERLR